MNADIGFVLICAAFVFFMTPGLACFYGGLVRKKNTVNTMMTSIFIIGTGIVMWVLFGYSLSFAPTDNGIIGNFSWLGLEGVSLDKGYTEGAACLLLRRTCAQEKYGKYDDDFHFYHRHGNSYVGAFRLLALIRADG